MNQTISIKVGDGAEMRAYVSRPAGDERRPAMMVFQEALGVNSQIRGVADRWADEGFVAIAPDLFHRTRPGYEADALDMEQIMPLIKSLTTEGLAADSAATHSWLTNQSFVDASRISAVGFCMGGRAAFIANSELPLAAAISYYGGSLGPLLDRAARLHGPHLFFWGGVDKGIPPEQRRAVVDAVEAAGKLFVSVEFSDANHAFFNEVADRYNAPAAKQSWALSRAFISEHLGIGGEDA